ncbi:MAG TPA: aspartyl protease family protein [Pyrinomonadaceae bacterium]|nr:aspartyl protease family protein [Pyrinomonadaceae bacterium]
MKFPLNSSFYRLAVCGLAAVVICFALAGVVAASPVDNEKTRSKALKALRAGDFEKAEKIYRDLLAKDEKDLDARLGLSHALLKERRLQDAFDHAARAIASDPLSAQAHALLGSVVLATGDFRLSVEEFRTAITLKPDEAMAIAGLAMIDFYENRIAPCVNGLRRAISIDPDEPDYLFDLGQAAARSKHYKEAADAYQRFLTIAPRTDENRRARLLGWIDFLRYLGQQGELYSLGGADRSVLSFDAVDYRPIIKVRVNGGQELRFVLDTGSGMSVLSEETARKVGIRAVARGGYALAVGGGGRFEIVYGYVNSIDVGDVRIENVPVYIRHFYEEREPVDGYLGISALGRLIMTVDYGARRLTLIRQRNSERADLATIINRPGKNDNSAPTEARPGVEVPVRTTSSGFLSAEVSIEGIQRPLNFIFDTGATTTVLSEKLAALDEAQGFIQPGRMRVVGAAGITENVKMALLPKLGIGTYTRQNIDAAVLDLEPVNEASGFQQSGILGGNFLRYFRVVFDFQRGLVRLEPLESNTVLNENTPRTEATTPQR